MSVCGKITAGITRNCLDKMVNGLEDELILINWVDVDREASEFDANNKMIITDIVLKTISPPASGFKIEGQNASNEHNTALVKRRFVNGWDQNLMFRVFDNTPEVKEILRDAEQSRFVAIIKNKYNNRNATTPGTTVFEVLGWEHGLELNEVTRNAGDEESAGGWVLTAGCDETLKEPYPPYTFFDTSLAVTQAKFDAFV